MHIRRFFFYPGSWLSSKRSSRRSVYSGALPLNFVRVRLPAICVVLGLIAAGCESPSRQVVYVPQEAPPQEISPAPILVAPLIDDEERQRRYIADILFDGMRALRADRLMTPAEDSAYYYFSRALAFEPDNQVAKDGMQDIVVRYLQLADTASRQGQFDNAEQFLRRAAQVDERHSGIAAARRTLQAERQSTHSVHQLNARELRERQPGLSQQLQELARLIGQIDAFVLITAPNDESGRWIYAQLQQALGSYRVRGDIEIGAQPTVRLVLPRSNT
jgi:tetratricopeptide (TPR) repeat protein